MATKQLSEFELMKRNREKRVQELIEKKNNPEAPKFGPDPRFWQPAVDKAKNGSAIIRFLPAAPGESDDAIQMFEHGFKGPTGAWYIEKSLTTLGEKDPVAEYNTKLWNTGDEAKRNIVRAQKRKLYYISNIYVVKHPNRPEDEGKVFLFKYGKKIHDMIEDKLHPQFEDEVKINAFDLWEGANFKLRIRDVEGYRNYDKSEFDRPSPLSQDEEEMEKIWRSCHSLNALLARDNFKTYDELKTRLNLVLGLNEDTRQVTQRAENAPTSTTNAPPWEADNEEDEFIRRLREDA